MQIYFMSQMKSGMASFVIRGQQSQQALQTVSQIKKRFIIVILGNIRSGGHLTNNV